MLKILILSSYIFFTSCSNISLLRRSGEEGVDLGEVELSNTLNKAETLPETKPVETLRIGGERNGEVFVQEKTEELKIEQKKFKIGLSFGPGLIGTVAYINILKNFYRQNISPQIITGVEFGAIISSMYATGMTPEMIEWTFTKYLRERKNEEVFSAEWLKEIDEYLLSKLANKKIEEAKIKLIITLYDHNLKKTVYFDRGNIRDLLLLNLKISNQAVQYKTGEKYSSAFEKEIHNPNFLKKMGSDFVVTADVLTEKSELNVVNGYLQGIYGAAIIRLKKERSKSDFSYEFSGKNINIEDDNNLNAYILETSSLANKQFLNMNKKIAEKVNSMNQEDLGEQ